MLATRPYGPSLEEATSPSLIASPATKGGSRQGLHEVASMEWPTLSKIVIVGHYVFAAAAYSYNLFIVAGS